MDNLTRDQIQRLIASGPDSLRQMFSETQQVVQQAAPADPVPVRYVEPPVKVKGSIELYVTFQHESYIGLSLDELKERIIQVLEGERHPWLPQIHLGKLEIWKEEVRVGPEPVGIVTPAAPVGRGLPGIHDPGYVANAGNPDAGTGDGEEVGYG